MIFATDVYGSGKTKPSYMEKHFIVHFAERNVFRWMSSKRWKLHVYRRKSTFVETLYFLTQK
jgi:hypothetical protein